MQQADLKSGDMLWIHLTMLFILIPGGLTGRFNQKENRCLDNSWYYIYETYKCTKLIYSNVTWIEASDECAKFIGGSNMDKTGHLVRIEEYWINYLVKETLPHDTFISWIGMHYDKTKNGYRWDRFPDEEPRFYDFVEPLDQRNPVRFPYVNIRRDGWHKGDLTQRHSYICEHEPRLDKIEMSCPPGIVKENTLIMEPFSCQINFNVYMVLWFSPFSHYQVAECNGPEHCWSYSHAVEARLSDTLNSKLFLNDTVTRHFQGKWTCSVQNSVSVNKSCDIYVVAKPNPMECSTEMYPHGLKVRCHSTKIFPKASCQWSYKNEQDTDYQPLPANDTHISYTHTSYMENNVEYFESTCEVLFSSDDVSFLPGRFMVHVIMMPDVLMSEIDDIDESMKQDLTESSNADFNIDLPGKPDFFHNNKIINGSLLTLYNNDEMKLSCEVTSGNPPVYATTISCDFPLTSGTVNGTLYVLTRQVEMDMDGKICRCWGNHIRGKSQISQLVFSIKDPPSEDSGLATGAIIGIVLTCIVIVLVTAILLAIFIYRRSRGTNSSNSNNPQVKVTKSQQKSTGEDNTGFQSMYVLAGAPREIPAGGENKTVSNSNDSVPKKEDTTVYSIPDEGGEKNEYQELDDAMKIPEESVYTELSEVSPTDTSHVNGETGRYSNISDTDLERFDDGGYLTPI